MQSFVILSYYSFWLIPPVVTETIIAWDRLYRRVVFATLTLLQSDFMFIYVDSTAFVNYVNMAFAIKISRLMITSIMYHRLTLVLLYLQTKIYYQESVTQISSKSACIISARFSQLNNQTSNQLFKCNFGFAFRSSLVIIDKENVNLITYL